MLWLVFCYNNKMNLTIEKYQRLCNYNKLLKQQGDALEDIVFAYVFRFEDESRIKDNFALFSFHFLLDKYENDVVLAEHILTPNNITGKDFFWHFGKDRKGNRKNISINIENSHAIKLKRTEFSLPIDNLNFQEVYNLVELECKKDQEYVVKFLNDNKVGYSKKFLNQFKKDLTENFAKYLPIVVRSLDGDVEKFNISALEKTLQKTLPNKDSSSRKIKI